MDNDWKKAILIPVMVAKTRDAANLTSHFHGGRLLHKGGTRPKFNEIGNTFYMI